MTWATTALAVVAVVAAAVSAQPTFTGNALADFSGRASVQRFDDPEFDVEIPFETQSGGSGWDVRAVFAEYILAEDTLYVGVDNVGIFGDADGNGDPGTRGPELAADGGADLPNLNSAEAFAFVIEIDGEPKYVVGVDSVTMSINDFGLFNFDSSSGIFTPAQGWLGPVVSGPTATVFANPSASQPNLEFTISQFSVLANRPLGVPFRFGFFIFSNSGADFSIGGDRAPDSQGFYTFELLSSVGDFVWNDLDGDGEQDPGEPGLPDVTVQLWRDGAIAPFRSQSTDADGRYLFDELLRLSNIQVSFLNPDPAIYARSPTLEPGVDPTLNSDAQADGFTALFSISEPSLLDGFDAGFFRKPEIGGTVYEDRNADGNRAAGGVDPPVAGATVLLLDGSFQLVGQQSTDAQGRFSFIVDNPGDYRLSVPLPTGFVDYPPQQINGNRADPAGVTPPVTLTASTVIDNLLVGMFRLSRLEGQAFEDENGDGLRNDGLGSNAGISGFTMELQDAGGAVLGSTLTDLDGRYGFDDLRPGFYRVATDVAPYPPILWRLAPDGRGTDASIDSDFDPATNATGLVAVQSGLVAANVDAAAVDVTPPTFISGIVWEDLNANGIREPGDPVLPDVDFNLYRASEPFVPIDSTLSNADGVYNFRVLPGTYLVEVVVPRGRFFTQLTNTLAGDSVFSEATARSPPATLELGDTVEDYDVGMWGPSSVGNKVFSDPDGDGLQQQSGGDAGIEGVQVRLLTVSGTLIDATTTDVNGEYRFGGVVPGRYQVVFGEPPAGLFIWQFSPANIGRDDSLDSDANPLTGESPVFALESRSFDGSWDCGFVDVTPTTCAGNCGAGSPNGCSRPNGDCECLCDDLCLTLGDCCEDFCFRCFSTDRQGCGAAVGDPHLKSYFGEAYDVQGRPGQVFNVLSDRDVQVNALFAQGCRTKKTVFGAVGVQYKTHTIEFAPNPDDAVAEPRIMLDGREMPLDQIMVLEDDEDAHTTADERRRDGELGMRSLMAVEQARMDELESHMRERLVTDAPRRERISVYAVRSSDASERYGGPTLQVVLPQYSLYMVHRVHTHCGTARIDLQVQFTDPDTMPHGLLGVTKRNNPERRRQFALHSHPELDEQGGGLIEGQVDDYAIESNHLFGNDFMFNQFDKETHVAARLNLAEDLGVGVVRRAHAPGGALRRHGGRKHARHGEQME